jgi:hypothetical protein
VVSKNTLGHKSRTTSSADTIKSVKKRKDEGTAKANGHNLGWEDGQSYEPGSFGVRAPGWSNLSPLKSIHADFFRPC